jgi:uncharacterized protein YfaS (alpha-2-macroglobulin family)
MKRLAGFLSAVLLAVLAVVLVNRQMHKQPVEAQPAAAVVATTAPAPPPPVAPPAPVAVPFGFLRAVADLTQARPGACLTFTAPLDSRPETHYRDWVALTPAPDAQYRVRGKSLCIDGLTLGRKYQVAMAAGFPAQNGEKLVAAATATIDFGDRPKMVGFGGQGTILSRDAASAGVTLDTVNVDTVAVEVLRIGDRLAPSTIKTLRSEPPNYQYRLIELADQSARAMWSGTMETKGPRNEVVHTAFPLGQAAEPRQPGVYLLVAANAADLRPRAKDKQFLWQRSDNYEFATQIVVQTDIALTAVIAADGLHIFTRSLGTAGPLGGIEVQLQARDSQVLGKAVTDAAGHAVLPPGLLRGSGAASANAVVAFGPDQDFAVLDLTQAAFDLSDRGVAGRDVPGPLDAFVYTDRGIYRPGEHIHAMALLRDRVGAAIDDGGITLSLRRPNGVVFKRAVLTPQPAGGFRVDYDLPDTASRGVWHLTATDADDKTIGETGFEVQDFVPQRIKVTARSDATKLAFGDTVSVAIDGRFLYGAPAGGLGAEAHMNIAVDPAPFPQSAQGYRFGLDGADFKPVEGDLTAEPANAEGHAVATGKLDVAPPPSVALKATITAGLQEPGGRVTSDTVSIPIRAGKSMVGIRPRFKDAQVREGDEAGFEIIAVDNDGKPLAGRLHWTLIEQIHHYDWYLAGGRWNFHRTDTEKAIDAGDLDAMADRPAVLVRKFGWGDYRLVVEGADKSIASFSFRSGWAATDGAADTPDKVEVTVERERYKLGETARLRIVPPFAGKVRLMVARDKVFETRELDVPRDGATVDIPVGADWGSGAYVLASLYRPADGGRGHLPIRAIGLAWVGVDPGAHLLQVGLKLPAKILPRQTVQVPLTIAGGVAGEEVYLTVAAVDEGILQLTRFKTPDPEKYYFGQRRLAIEVRDDYGHLLDGTQGEVGKIRSGGDAFGGKGLPVVPTRSVSLFQGPVTVGADGKVSVPIEIPDFEGELRVMAIAYSHSAIGKAEAPLTVRDPVVPDLAMPRFLAPGDTAKMTLLIDNLDGEAGAYKAALSISGAATMPGAQPWQDSLKKGERVVTTFPIAGTEEGIATVTVTLTGPNALSIVRSWSIAVRPAHYPVVLESVVLQKQNDPFKLDPMLADAFVPGSASVQIGYSRLAGMDVAGLLQSLWRYPYGCTEQLASTSFPLTYYDDPALSSGAADKAEVHKRVQSAIDRIVDRQDPEGTFGLWRAGDGLASNWLNLYALDFLLHAKDAGYDVPDSAIERGYANAESLFRGNNESAGMPGSKGDTAAYAAWLLAPVHRVDLGRLRQIHDGLQIRPTLVAWDAAKDNRTAANPLALAQFGGALATMGDRSRGANALSLAIENLERPFVAQWWESTAYWSRIRDASGILAVAAESEQLPATRSLLPRLQALSKAPSQLTTQEKAWLLVAAHAVTAGDKSVGLTVNGKPVEAARGQAVLRPTAAEIVAGYIVAPTGQDLWRTTIVRGSPKQAPPPLANGLSLTKQFFAQDGTKLDPSSLPQNRRFIVVLQGGATDRGTHRLALVDLLPAGWEIEGVVKPDQAPAFLGQLTRPRAREARDDRLVVALDLGEDAYYYRDWVTDEDKAVDTEARKGKFTIAYVVRATTPGVFTLPEAVVEDMYRPGVMARTAAGQVRVTER